MLILGVTGPIAAGKGELTEIAKSQGFVCFGLGNEAREETTKRGLPLTRDNIRATAKEVQAKFGRTIWAMRVVEKIRSRGEGNFLVDGFRVPIEVELFNKEFGGEFKLVAVTASFETRFARARARNREGEPLTREAFKNLDNCERGLQPCTGYAYEVDECVKNADYVIENEGSLKEFEEKIEKLLSSI